MNVFLFLYFSLFHRRRRQRKYFLLILVILLIFFYICFYRWIEINDTFSSSVVPDKQHQNANDSLQERHSILYKYRQHPYAINVSAIIDEANSKYQQRTKNKYLVYSCRFMCGGWGDRTRKIVASFLLSLALNRTFLIDMTWPCSIERTLTSNLISWSVSSHSHIRNLSSSSINITSLLPKEYQKLKSFHQQYSILNIQTNNIAYFDLIARRPEFYIWLFNRFGIKREHIHIVTLYPLFYELLIKLKPHLQEKLDRLHLDGDQTDLSTSSLPLLCGHLRIGRNPSNPKDAVFPNRERMNTTVLNFLRSRPGRIFITSDSQEVQKLAREMFTTGNNNDRRRLIEINGTIAHIDRDWNYLGCESLEKTILDFHALSHCQLAVISKSSFGYLAVIRRWQPYEELYLYCDGIKTIASADDYDKYTYSTC